MDQKDNEARLSREFFEDASTEQIAWFRRLALKGGIRWRLFNGDFALRSSVPSTADSLLRLTPLQTSAGRLRADARESLVERGVFESEVTESMASDIRDRWLEFQNLMPLNNLQTTALRLVMETDPIPAISDFIEEYASKGQGSPRLFRLEATPIWQARENVWRALFGMADHGARLRDFFETGRLPPADPASPTRSFQSGLWVGPPLACRNQPLAVVLSTCRGVEIVVVVEGAWIRSPNLGTHPMSLAAISLAGPGENLYKTSHPEMAKDLGERTLKTVVRGANRLASHLTDPGAWQRDGEVDPLRRSIAASTVDLGFSALSFMAQEWGSSECIWTAMRALGILDGLWSSDRRGHLSDLLNPDVIQDWGLSPDLPDDFIDLARDVLSNYRGQLQALFPDTDVTTAAERMREARNLVHGTVAHKNRYRSERDRLDVLRRVGTGSMVHLQDISTYWWTTVLMNPSRYCQLGTPPWDSIAQTGT